MTVQTFAPPGGAIRTSQPSRERAGRPGVLCDRALSSARAAEPRADRDDEPILPPSPPPLAWPRVFPGL